MPKLSKNDRELLKRFNYDKELLAFFDLNILGFEPGVSFYTNKPETEFCRHAEWAIKMDQGFCMWKGEYDECKECKVAQKYQEGWDIAPLVSLPFYPQTVDFNAGEWAIFKPLLEELRKRRLADEEKA